jgi:hypothetical protein
MTSDEYMWRGKVFRFFINKYFLTTLGFVIWMLFFDSNNFLTRRKLKEKLEGYRQEKEFYLHEIYNDSLMNVKLQSDSSAIEQFAREKYLMKREQEDLFLVIDTSNPQK